MVPCAFPSSAIRVRRQAPVSTRSRGAVLACPRWGIPMRPPCKLPGLTFPASAGSLMQACECRSSFEKDSSCSPPSPWPQGPPFISQPNARQAVRHRWPRHRPHPPPRRSRSFHRRMKSTRNTPVPPPARNATKPPTPAGRIPTTALPSANTARTWTSRRSRRAGRSSTATGPRTPSSMPRASPKSSPAASTKSAANIRWCASSATTRCASSSSPRPVDASRPATSATIRTRTSGSTCSKGTSANPATGATGPARA